METYIRVHSQNVKYKDDHITSKIKYSHNNVKNIDGVVHVTPQTDTYKLQTDTKIPRFGMMLVGLGGNNGTTCVGSIIANREGITWKTKSGVNKPNYFGSITQSSTMRMGFDFNNNEVTVPLNRIVPMVNPSDIVVGGWDICNMNLSDAMDRNAVFDYDLQCKLKPYMRDIIPLPSIYGPSFIASNQKDRANNCISGTKREQVAKIRQDIRDFKNSHNLESIIVLCTATTERFSEVKPGLNDTADNILSALDKNEEEISPSSQFAIACILENVSYINGSPQNTFVPGIIELAKLKNVFICGDDFKSGQTKLKSSLVEYLMGAGIKPKCIASYNHLGNNDGLNLSSAKQLESKEITKSGVIDDMVASNSVLYKDGERPDHCIVIKYMPAVGDSKRAIDEYTSEIFMGGINTMVIHNTCEDSLLAAPLILDLVILCELMERVRYDVGLGFSRFHSICSLLSYLMKAPLVPNGTPCVNALSRQKSCIDNFLRALVGLQPENNLLLEYKTSG
jgi:myo-inositol-1-phosphate synthase